jgi:hypothetical protein
MLWCGHSLFLPPPTLHTKEAPKASTKTTTNCCSTVSLFGVAGRGEQLVVRIATRAAARVLGPPSPFANAPAYASRLPSQQPRAWSRRSQGTYRWATMNQQPLRGGRGVRQRVARRELDAHEWTGVGELRTVWNPFGLHCLSLSLPTQ